MAFPYAQFVAVELALRDDRRRAQREFRLFRRNLRDVQDPFSVTDTEFIRTYRLNKEACADLINRVGAIATEQRLIKKISPSIMVLTTLSFFASGSYQRHVGHSLLNAVSQATVSRCIKLVSTIITRYFMKQWIKFPQSEVDKAYTKNRFLNARGMPHILGIVDGTHVAIVKPHVNEHAYVNRKGYHSINVQIICDNDLKIISIMARFPGNAHDAFVWRQSAVAHNMQGSYEAGDHVSRLIGDSGYPRLPWLLTPLRNPVTRQEQRYNNTLKVTRSSIERCIGVLKGRFRCLLKDRTLHYTPQCASRIIMACAVLHNISMHYNIPQAEPRWDDIDHEHVEIIYQGQGDMQYRHLGQQNQQNYIQTYF